MKEIIEKLKLTDSWKNYNLLSLDRLWKKSVENKNYISNSDIVIKNGNVLKLYKKEQEICSSYRESTNFLGKEYSKILNFIFSNEEKILSFKHIIDSTESDAFSNIMINIKITNSSNIKIFDIYEITNNLDFWNNIDINIEIENSSRLSFYRLYPSNKNVFFTGNNSIKIGKNSSLFYYINQFDSLFSRTHLVINHIGENSESNVVGLLFSSDIVSGIESETLIKTQNTKHSEFFRCISKNKGKTVWNSKVKIEKDAIETNSCQQNKNILLDRDSQSISKPELEILCSNVVATHGNTTSKINENEIFYLNQRGLNIESSKKLIYEGFINEIFESISDSTDKISIKNWFEEQVNDIRR